MPTKYQLVTELYNRTLREVTANHAHWTGFLRAACYNYKCSFDEQILIYAQRPDATAVLELERWNRSFGRWINRGASGIAVFDDAHGKGRLKYYFDISDTHADKRSKSVPTWRMSEDLTEPVIETLEATFGDLEDKTTFGDAILSASRNAVADNLLDYLRDLHSCCEGSLLEELDALNVEVAYRSALETSVAYMLLTRLGMPTDEFLMPEDFADVFSFNTLPTINAIGTATTDIAEIALREISRTVLAAAKDLSYNTHNGVRDTHERSDNHGDYLSRGERREIAESSHAAAARRDVGQIRGAAPAVSAQASENPLYEPVDDRQADRTSGGDRTAGDRDGQPSDPTDVAGRGRDGGSEGNRSNALGRTDEQLQARSGGADVAGSDLRLISSENAGGKTLPAFFDTDLMEAIILDEGGRKVKRQQIFAYFQQHTELDARQEFLKNAYTDTYVEILVDDARVGYKKQDDGLLMWEGSYLSRISESVFSWGVVTELTVNLMERGEYRIDLPSLQQPTMVEQLTLFGMDDSAVRYDISEPIPDFPTMILQSIPQQVIDQTLYTAGNEPGSAYRVAAFYMRERPESENIAFLRREFGTENGRGIEYEGRKYAVWFEEDGIHLAQGDSVRTGYSRTTITWEQASQRILELMNEGTYLSSTELMQAQDKAIGFMADSLLMTAREVTAEARSTGLFTQTLAIHDQPKGYPDLETDIVAFTHNEGGLAILAQEYHSFLEAYANDQNITRFRISEYNTHRIGVVLDGLEYPERHFDAKPDFLRQCKMFITQDELDHLLISEHHDTQLAIYSKFCNTQSAPERQKFLKSSYGEYSGSGCAGYNTTKTSKGLTFQRAYEWKEYDTVQQSFPRVLQRYERLMAGQRFPTEDALANIPAYETHQLARTVYFAFSYLPTSVPKPYPKDADYYAAIPAIETQLTDLARVQEMTEALSAALDTLSESDRHYDNIKQAQENLRALTDGTFTLFSHHHDGLAAQLMPEHPMYETRPMAEGTNKPVVKYLADGEHIIITQARNRKYFNKYGYDEATGHSALTAGGFETLETAENALHEHRPTAKRVAEPEKSVQPPLSISRIDNPTPQLVPEQIEPQVILPPVHTAVTMDPLDLNGTNHRITDDALGVGTPSVRYAANVAAIRLLQTLEREQRTATPNEQHVLSCYVGWGGLADCFDARHSKYGELKALLTDVEYAAARESTLTAFYTPPTVIRAMYQALANMGFQQGNLLEPACGIGNFLGMLPDEMANSNLYGVELDSVSGRIAQQLYPRARIAVQGFEKTAFSDNFFDVAVGNVPFGQFKVADRRYDRLNFSIHEYFLAKTLDKVRPGGVIAFVTSSYTMDKHTSNVRKYIAQRAELIGAIRLPNDTFKSAAGTEVVSDILFLQKRDRMVDIEPDWVQLDTNADGIQMNTYFVQHPEMVLGEMKLISGPYGPEPTCAPYPEADLDTLLTGAIANLHAEITDYKHEDELDGEDTSIEADPMVRNFSYTLQNGALYYRENSRMRRVDVSKTADSRIRGMIELRDCVRQLIDYQLHDYSDAEITRQQAVLNTLYDDFTKRYGLISSRANAMAFEQDSSYFLLTSLEIINEDGKLERKADLFTKRTIRSHKPAEAVDTAAEALAVSIGEKACVDLAYMEQLTGRSETELLSDLSGVVFRNPDYVEGVSAVYLPADEYLSGNVRQKLDRARALAANDPQYQVHVDALTAVQPTDLTASEISVRLGATWLKPAYVRQFLFETLNTKLSAQSKIQVFYSDITGEWRIQGKSYDSGNIKANSTYGTSRATAYEIVEDSLNLKDVRIFDYIYDASGHRNAVLNKKETAIAQSKQELLRDTFTEWLWSDPNRREDVCHTYNVLFNSNRPREYDGSHIVFGGINPEITLRPHQTGAIAHILYGGNTLLAHTVGAGKTFEMVAAAMESKRLGLCQKSLFVVPNHLTEQWASEFLQLYPAANILVATKKDFETKNRKRFCGRIATGDYDAVIIGHSQFEKIPMSIERQTAILEQQMDEVLMGIEDAKHDKAENFTIKQMEKTRKSLQLKLDKLNDQTRKDDVVTFEELGCDRLFVDESHGFKNLFLYTKMRNVGGIAQTEAQKSSDLFMKCRYLDEITGGRGIIFATGTPISNSMVELYTIQRYLQMNALREQGLQHFDAWAANYGETVTAIELSPEGTGYRAKTRFAKFYNLPELMSVFKNVADIQTADMLKLPVPEAHYHNVVLKPSEYQKEIVASLAERAERVRSRAVDSSIDNMLLITNDGRKLALDQRLVNPMLPDDPNCKAAQCADNVFAIWQRTADQRSTQMIFCDLSTPKGDGSFSVYDDIRAKLLSKGIPDHEIAFIHNAKTEVQKKDLFSKVRAGQVRVLLGSTQRMGAGTNAQQKLVALHHLDCPWRPSDLQQREGRIIRQGNENPEVDIYSYVTEGTFDAYLYQLVESKQKFISQIMTSKSPVRAAEDIDDTALSYAEIKALASGNPFIKEKMDLDIEVSKLKLLKANHLSQRYSLEDAIAKHFPKEIAEQQTRIAGYSADIATVQANMQCTEDGFFPLTLFGKTYTDKKAAGSALLELCHNLLNPEATRIGNYRGLELTLSFDSIAKAYRLSMIGKLRHTISLGIDVFGNLQRMDNALEAMPTQEQTCHEHLDELRKQLETAKQEVLKPFARESELQIKVARLEELNALLNMDEKEPITEPEQQNLTTAGEFER